MKHEKTFAAINKLKDVELELHRLKNALEMANKALDAQRPWVGLTDEDARIAALEVKLKDRLAFDAGMFAAANILKEKNT